MKLAIDTTSGFVQLALMQGDDVYIKKSSKDNAQAEEVAILLDELLKETGSKFEDVKEIYCVIGPGSFTGLRVGVAFVKGLVIGSDIKVVAVSNFHFYLANYVEELNMYTQVDVLIDCGKNKEEFFYQSFLQDGSLNGDAKILSYEEVRAFKTDNLVLGDFSVVQYSLDENFKACEYKSLKIENIFKLPNLSDEYKFEPLYIRPTYVK